MAEKSVVVEGIVEAAQSATWEHHGREVFVRGPDAGRHGSLLPVGHPLVKGHEHLFRPLVIELDFGPE